MYLDSVENYNLECIRGCIEEIKETRNNEKIEYNIKLANIYFNQLIEYTLRNVNYLTKTKK